MVVSCRRRALLVLCRRGARQSCRARTPVSTAHTHTHTHLNAHTPLNTRTPKPAGRRAARASTCCPALSSCARRAGRTPRASCLSSTTSLTTRCGGAGRERERGCSRLLAVALQEGESAPPPFSWCSPLVFSAALCCCPRSPADTSALTTHHHANKKNAGGGGDRHWQKVRRALRAAV